MGPTSRRVTTDPGDNQVIGTGTMNGERKRRGARDLFGKGGGKIKTKRKINLQKGTYQFRRQKLDVPTKVYGTRKTDSGPRMADTEKIKNPFKGEACKQGWLVVDQEEGLTS